MTTAELIHVRSNTIPKLVGEYRTIVADPPWEVDMEGGSFESRKNGNWDREKVSALPYAQMTLDQISGLRIPSARDAHLYVWTINKYIEQTYSIARAWGFCPSALLTWIKQPMGLGLGGSFCSNTEFILFCRKGNLPTKRKLDTRWWGWPRGEHSQKPEEFQTIVESVSPGPYLEMFARRKRDGWDVWGNEV